MPSINDFLEDIGKLAWEDIYCDLRDEDDNPWVKCILKLNPDIIGLFGKERILEIVSSFFQSDLAFGDSSNTGVPGALFPTETLNGESIILVAFKFQLDNGIQQMILDVKSRLDAHAAAQDDDDYKEYTPNFN